MDEERGAIVKTEMVLGFLFSPDSKQVVLIEKKKPKWQVGKLNGIGGKVKLKEPYHDAMIRECKEETGVHVPSWRGFAQLKGPNFLVNCFTAWSPSAFAIEQMENEKPILIKVSELHRYPLIGNLHWLIHMALDLDFENRAYALIRYHTDD